MRGVMRSLASVLGGLALLSAAVVLPDGLGRTGPAVAEVIHDGTDTTGQIHMAVDCDVVTPGTQDHCVVLPGPLDVDVTLGNSTASDKPFYGFGFHVTTNETILDPTNPVFIPPWGGGNPDVNEEVVAAPGGEMTCNPVAPTPDTNPDPAVATSFVYCANAGNAYPLPATSGHVSLAAVHYTALAVGLAEISFALGEVHSNVYPEDPPFVHYYCTEPWGTDIPCFGATIEVVAPGGDYDGDGVVNSADNCIGIANADQHNADANLFVQVPTLGVNDLSRANSDNMGNACDDDDDNDGLSDAAEGTGCNGGLPTSVTSFDTDGDRYLDGAECARGADPLSAASKPTPAQCGATTDVDGDRLMERIERCHYNTDPAANDSDGDGMKDGCEAASLNGDGVVNSADQLLFSLQHLSVLAGFGAFANTDINKDGNYNSIDQLLMAFLIIPSGQCP